MPIDTTRWTRLCAEIEDLQAHANGLSARWSQLSERRNNVVRELMQVEAQRGRQYGPRPAQGMTFEAAQMAVREANRLNPGTRRPITADHDVTWFMAQAVVDEVDAELARVAQLQDALSPRLGRLRTLRQQIERYAGANGIGLEGVNATVLAARLPGVAPAPAPPAGATVAASAMGVRR